MMLSTVTATIKTAALNIRLHGNYLAQNEYRTRAVLIDPLLQALEWDTANPDQVQVEYQVNNGYADYALLSHNKPIMVIEAKKLREDLRPHFNQARSYATEAEVPYFSLTDGNVWRTFHVSQTTYTARNPVLSANLTNNNPITTAKRLIPISQSLLTTQDLHIAKTNRKVQPNTPNPD